MLKHLLIITFKTVQLFRLLNYVSFFNTDYNILHWFLLTTACYDIQSNLCYIFLGDLTFPQRTTPFPCRWSSAVLIVLLKKIANLFARKWRLQRGIVTIYCYNAFMRKDLYCFQFHKTCGKWRKIKGKVAIINQCSKNIILASKLCLHPLPFTSAYDSTCGWLGCGVRGALSHSRFLKEGSEGYDPLCRLHSSERTFVKSGYIRISYVILLMLFGAEMHKVISH